MERSVRPRRVTLLGIRFFLFALSSFCLWWISPSISGEREPVDAGFPLVSTWLFFSGLIGGLWPIRSLPSASILMSWFGSVLGQTVAILVLPGIDHSWWMLGFVVAIFTGLWVVLGEVIAKLFRSSDR